MSQHAGSCRSCGADLIWAETTNNVPQPFNRQPDPEGNRLLLGRGSERAPLAIDPAIVDGASGMIGTLIDECRYMPHHATCINADQHRNR